MEQRQAKPNVAAELSTGAIMQILQISSLGQPFEVLKTHMAAHRGDTLAQSLVHTWKRGGIAGFYQGLIPWAWVECSTKGAVLLLASSEIKYYSSTWGLSPVQSSLLAGMGGGLAQAYTTMGICTFMKTVEVTRAKGTPNAPSTLRVAYDVWRQEGIVGLNKGVSAVALRQLTNWGSRFGISKATETLFLQGDPSRKLSGREKIAASMTGGVLACWNHPIEVIRVEMQSVKAERRGKQRISILDAARNIHSSSGLAGFWRGVVPRMCLGAWQTVFLVAGGDRLKDWLSARQRSPALERTIDTRSTMALAASRCNKRELKDEHMAFPADDMVGYATGDDSI